MKSDVSNLASRINTSSLHVTRLTPLPSSPSGILFTPQERKTVQTSTNNTAATYCCCNSPVHFILRKAIPFFVF